MTPLRSSSGTRDERMASAVLAGHARRHAPTQIRLAAALSVGQNWHQLSAAEQMTVNGQIRALTLRERACGHPECCADDGHSDGCRYDELEAQEG